MKVCIVDFVEGARTAEGVAVVIDVFRAFSVACYAFANGAARIHPVGDVEDARRLREKLQGALLIGERRGKMLPGFDFGNSPTEILKLDLSGKTLIHTTHAGTQGLINATRASSVYTGAFVNAAATVRAVHRLTPQTVTLVRMGLEARERSDEDDLCAEYLKSLLLEESFDVEEIKPTLRRSPYSERFFDPQQPWSPSTDFDLCLEVDKFDFAVQATYDDSLLTLHQIPS